MGYDIKGFVEKVNREDGSAECTLGRFFLRRNYLVYALLCGAHNDFGVEPVSEPKGLPEKRSAEVETEQQDGWDEGWYSWFSLEELEEFQRRYTEIEKQPEKEIEDIMAKMKAVEDEHHVSRLVFWIIT